MFCDNIWVEKVHCLALTRSEWGRRWKLKKSIKRLLETFHLAVINLKLFVEESLNPYITTLSFHRIGKFSENFHKLQRQKLRFVSTGSFNKGRGLMGWCLLSQRQQIAKYLKNNIACVTLIESSPPWFVSHLLSKWCINTVESHIKDVITKDINCQVGKEKNFVILEELLRGGNKNDVKSNYDFVPEVNVELFLIYFSHSTKVFDFFFLRLSRFQGWKVKPNTLGHLRTPESVYCLMYQLLFYLGDDQSENKHQLVMLTQDAVDIGHMPCNLNVCVCLNNLMIRWDSFFRCLWGAILWAEG